MTPTLLSARTPGPYRVVFSTRVGGVSDGPYASLNIGLLTDDAPERVIENRRRLAEAAGADPHRAAMAWQQHGPVVERAVPTGILQPGAPLARCDGLWTDEPGVPLMLVTADCLPIAVWRTAGRPALAVLHAGWRGLLAGIVEAGCRALGPGPLAAAAGPAIAACCYEVGDDVARPFSQRFGGAVIQDRRLDLRGAAERALLEAGCDTVEHLDGCTACREDLFFSHRRDRGTTGRQGIMAHVRG